MFAIVDIETTGGYAADNGITEIAVFVHDGTRVVESYTTLINPGVTIPLFIEGYTGITNEMVAEAPHFNEVSHKIYELLHDKIFVAHNVNFDHTFIKHHLASSGYEWNPKKLCTVRLSRKLFPGYKSYSLGNLCSSMGIELQDRHRAFGDAAATVTLFERILQAEDGRETIGSFLKKGSKEANLPPNLPKEQYEALPSNPGVYYFYDEKGKIIYVGKAVNIRKRVLSHFSGTNLSAKRQDFMREIHHVSFESTATELMALILESIEIKKHWPKHNKSQKQLEFSFGIYDYEDQNGYIRLCIDRIRKNIKPLYTHRKLADAYNHLQKLVLEYNLCPKLCMINTGKGSCEALKAGCCSGACEQDEEAEMYNTRVHAAITELTTRESYAILDAGMEDDQISCILVDEGRFYGMGYISNKITITDPESVKGHIKPQKDNYFIRDLIGRQDSWPGKLIRFSVN
jgi:DNA polymerase III subunit epsilon